MSNDDLHVKYRRPNESEREWQLRKLFIEKHLDKYEEDRLLCLAQCFVNIQTMGCRYSFKIMNQIREMTSDLEPLIQERFKTTIKEIKTNQESTKSFKQPKQHETTTMKPKLISKTHLVNDTEIQFIKATPKPKIQILTRNTQQNIQTVDSPRQTSSYKNVVINSLTQPKPLKSVSSTPSVPATTTELAPAASTLPIPFGLSPNTNSRNVLLNMLKIEQNPKPDPLSILIGSSGPIEPLQGDDKFIRLNKINKLRDVLRSIKVVFDENFDLIEFFDNVCAENSVGIRYEHKFENEMYFGEIFIESYRLIKEQHKKRKKCKFYTYKRAYDILVSTAQLAVKLSNNQDEQNFEYELYRLDMDTPEKSTNNINDLNMLLRSMILPKDNGKSETTVNDDSKESQMELEEDNDDDDDESKSQGISKKTRIKQNLPHFCLFIPSLDINEQIDSSNIDKFIHDRNSLHILNQSCVKSSCNLEFEIKTRSQADQSQSKYVKTIISGDRIQAESDDELTGPNDPRKYKCKCLINGVKISSANAATKNDSKRLAALKAIKYLFKLFPSLKETSYQSIKNSSASAPAPSFVKITKDQLFGLVPPTLFETPIDNCLTKTSSLTLGEKLLKKMGWKGNGLGKNEQGIVKAVEFTDISRTRYGLGFSYHYCDGYDDELHELDCVDSIASIDLNLPQSNVPQIKTFNNRHKMKMHEFIQNIRTILNDFMSSETEKDIVFDKCLSVEDRKIIHKEAHRFGLKTRSEGNGIERFLVVRKKQTSNEIFDSVLKNGGELNKYKIISFGDS